MSSELQQTQGTVLYVSGEEKQGFKLNAERLGMQADGFYIYAETNLEGYLAQSRSCWSRTMSSTRIQTMTHPQANAGCRKRLMCVRQPNVDATRETQSDCHLYRVGHGQKEGAICWPFCMLEHMVDTVSGFEGINTASACFVPWNRFDLPTKLFECNSRRTQRSDKSFRSL